jgi:hypothetical protein
VLHGTLTIPYLYLSGTLTIASSCTANLTSFYGPVTFAGILTNYGTVVWSSDNLYGSSAQIENYGLWNIVNDNGAFHGDASTFNNFGIFRKSGNSQNSLCELENGVNFNNSGTLDVQTGGLWIAGNYTLTGGTLNFGINSPNNFGSLYLNGNAALTGTLSVNFKNGYVPVADASFPLVSYGSKSGIFTAPNLPHLSPGLIWQTNYGSTTFTLIVTSAPPTVLSAATTTQNGTFSLSWNAIVGGTYQMQYTTNLAPVIWLDLGDPVTASNSTMTASDIIGLNPQRFYRLVWLQ